jgi:hypothetical protein
MPFNLCNWIWFNFYSGWEISALCISGYNLVYSYWCGISLQNHETLTLFLCSDMLLLLRICDHWCWSAPSPPPPHRLEYTKVKLAGKLGGVCDIDQIFILNSLDGPTTGQCGPLSGYSSKYSIFFCYRYFYFPSPFLLYCCCCHCRRGRRLHYHHHDFYSHHVLKMDSKEFLLMT